MTMMTINVVVGNIPESGTEKWMVKVNHFVTINIQ